MTRALIVVDVQNDFCEGGSLAVSGATAVAEAITEAVSGAVSQRWDLVVATRDWHVDPGPHFAPNGETPDFAQTWPVHCVAGTPGAELHPALRLPASAVLVVKGERQGAYSGFEGHAAAGRSLAGVLHDASVNEVEVVGIATSFCVAATATDAVAAGFATRLLTDLCADVDPTHTPATLQRLAAAGVTLTTLAAEDQPAG